MTHTIQEFKTLSSEQLKAYGDTIPLGSICDANENELTYKNSAGFWYEREYDTNDNELTYKDSDGTWNEYTYDSNSNELTFKNSTGFWCESTYDINNNELTSKNSIKSILNNY